MLSAIVFASTPATRHDRLGALVRTLGALIPLTIDGLVRDVRVAVPRPGRAEYDLAERSGCDLAGGDDAGGAFRHAIAAARQEWVLVVAAGASFERSMTQELSGLLVDNGAADVVGEIDVLGLRWRERLTLRRPIAGLVARKAALASLEPRDMAALSRGLRQRRIRLGTGARMML